MILFENLGIKVKLKKKIFGDFLLFYYNYQVFIRVKGKLLLILSIKIKIKGEKISDRKSDYRY